MAFVPRIPLPRAHHAATLVIAAALLPGCPCGTSTIVFSDDFEKCSDSCGWTVEGGGSADVSSTILMGEHGLHLTGAVTVSKPIKDITVPDLSIARLSLVTDCRAGLDVLLTTSRDGGPAEDIVALFPSNVEADASDFPAAKFIPFSSTLGDLRVNWPGLSAIKLRVIADQACTVDAVVLQTEHLCKKD